MKRYLAFILLVILAAVSCRETGRGDDTDESVAVTFKYVPLASERIETIYVTGDFNSWNTRNLDYLMEPQGDGTYALQTELKPGTYRYRLIINGRWITNMRDLDGRIEPVPVDYPKHDFGGVNAQFKVTSAYR